MQKNEIPQTFQEKKCFERSTPAPQLENINMLLGFTTSYLIKWWTFQIRTNQNNVFYISIYVLRPQQAHMLPRLGSGY